MNDTVNTNVSDVVVPEFPFQEMTVKQAQAYHNRREIFFKNNDMNVGKYTLDKDGCITDVAGYFGHKKAVMGLKVSAQNFELTTASATFVDRDEITAKQTPQKSPVSGVSLKNLS